MIESKTPPKHLRLATKRWWLRVATDWALEEHHVRLLTLAAEAWDRGVQAREAIDKHGLTFVDKHGQPRARPEVAVEQNSRIAFARMLRELSLDVEEPGEVRVPRNPRRT